MFFLFQRQMSLKLDTDRFLRTENRESEIDTLIHDVLMKLDFRILEDFNIETKENLDTSKALINFFNYNQGMFQAELQLGIMRNIKSFPEIEIKTVSPTHNSEIQGELFSCSLLVTFNNSRKLIFRFYILADNPSSPQRVFGCRVTEQKQGLCTIS
jgi:hypothetical protein